MKVQQITAEEAMDLRARILRPGQPLSTIQYAEDYSPTTFHLGLIQDGKIICNGTFISGVCDYFPDHSVAYRLRGMAVDNEFQGQGLGTQLLAAAEKILVERACSLLWFNARTTALHFYEKNGFVTVGEVFDIPGGGPHVVMYKFL